LEESGKVGSIRPPRNVQAGEEKNPEEGSKIVRGRRYPTGREKRGTQIVHQKQGKSPFVGAIAPVGDRPGP